jgi:ribonucleoside-diphosphate reductase alpha chain
MIAGCSSGIEPLFAIVYEKNVLDGKRLMEVHPGFRRVAQEEGFYSDELMNLVARNGSLNKIYGIPRRIRDVFVTSHDIDPQWHIELQAAFQKYTDNAVSKTVNFRSDATVADVEKVFRYAFDLNCKGVTVYRDGSRSGQVITTGTSGSTGAGDQGSTDVSARAFTMPVLHPRPRPAVTHGRTYKTKTGCGTLYVNINSDAHGFCEVFTQMGKSGGCAASNAEAVSRLVSLAMRSGIDPAIIVEQLRGIRCPIPTWHEGEMILSCADAIARTLEKAIKEVTGAETARPITFTGLDMGYCPQCPECGGIMENESGCSICKSCGYSKCG